jgi:predicted PurR-regulated permease PerM
LAALIVLIWGLQFAKQFLVPVALAIVISFLLTPLVERLERWRLNRTAAVLSVVSLAFLIVGIVGYVLVRQVKEIAVALPQYEGNIESKVESVARRLRQFSKMTHEIEKMAEYPATQPTNTANTPPGLPGIIWPQRAVEPVMVERPQEQHLSLLTISALTPALQWLATLFVVIVLVIFILLGREDLRDRIIHLAGQGRMNITTQAMQDASTRVSRYLLVQSLINGTYGILVAIGLTAIGVRGALLWGILFAALRFIPYAGALLGAALPCLLALALPGNGRFLFTVGMFVCGEVIVGSWIEPWLYGTHTGVSSVALLIAAVFWAWLWGGVGLLLATPLTVVLVVIGKYIPQLEFLSTLLGDEPVFETYTRYYQRLLASDQEEADEVVEEDLKIKPLEEVYEEVLMPALAMAELARHRDLIDEDRLAYIHRAMKDLVQELGERPPAPPTLKADDEQAGALVWPPVNGAASVNVLCLPASSEADEIAGMMLAQILSRANFHVRSVSVTPLASEMLQLVEEYKAHIVVISAVPPAAVTHARYLRKRLHARFPDLIVVVGLWTFRGDLPRAKRRIVGLETDKMVGTFKSALGEMGQLAAPLLLLKP